MSRKNVKIKEPKVFSLRKQCPMCEQLVYLRMTATEEKQWHEYVISGESIQKVCKDMDPQKREFIKSGYCPDCQEIIFGKKYDTSDYIFRNPDDELPEELQKFIDATYELKDPCIRTVRDQQVYAIQQPDLVKPLTTEDKVTLLHEWDMKNRFYVDDNGDIKPFIGVRITFTWQAREDTPIIEDVEDIVSCTEEQAVHELVAKFLHINPSCKIEILKTEIVNQEATMTF